MHNHSRSEYMPDSIVLANRIKRNLQQKMSQCTWNIFSNIYEASRSMCKRRRVELPKLLISPEEFVELLIDSPFSSNYRLIIRGGNDTAILFTTDHVTSKLVEIETIHFDGTFKVVPHIFYQLFTILVAG